MIKETTHKASIIVAMFTITITLTAGEPGKSGTVSAVCPSGTELTGGAYRKSPDVIIFTSAPTSDNTAWEVSGVNGNTSIDVFITSVAECGKLVS